METPVQETLPPISLHLDALAKRVVDCGFRVHSTLGPGLLESAYEHCLAYEIQKHDIRFQRQVALPITYDGVRLDAGFRIDLLVEDAVIVEVKSVAEFAPIHQSQILTYLRLSGCRLGLLMNFNVKLFKQGVRRLAL